MGSTDELEEAAQHRRDREAERVAAESAAQAKAAAEAPEAERRSRLASTRLALAEAGRAGTVLPVTGAAIGLLAPIVSGTIWLRRTHSDSFLLIMLLSLVSLASAAAAIGSVRLLARLRWRRVLRIGRGFEARPYLDALGENRTRGVLLPSLVDVVWVGDVLALRTAELSGTAYVSSRYGAGGRTFDNQRFHGAFLQILRDVVPRLEKVAPIAALAAKIDGPVEPWDARA